MTSANMGNLGQAQTFAQGRWEGMPIMYSGGAGDAPVSASKSQQPQQAPEPSWASKAGSMASGAWDHVSKNPDLYLNLLAPFMPRGMRAPVAAAAGAAEVYKYGQRADDYAQQATKGPGYKPGSEPGTYEKTPAPVSGKAPRSQPEAALAATQNTAGYAEADRRAADEEEKQLRALLAQLMSTAPKPGQVSQGATKPILGQRAQGAPSLEQIAKLLVSRGTRFGPQQGQMRPPMGMGDMG